jgi:hypothetical protein
MYSYTLSSFINVNMIDIAVISLCIYLVCLTSLFIFGFSISQPYNSIRIFYLISIVCFLLALYMPIYAKYHSPWTLDIMSSATEFSAGMGFIFALKFLILAFGEDWTLTRKMTPKQIVRECFTFPLTVAS